MTIWRPQATMRWNDILRRTLSINVIIAGIGLLSMLPLCWKIKFNWGYEVENVQMINPTVCSWYFEAKTKWPPVCRRHFETDFLQWKLFYFDTNFTSMCSQGSIIGSNNGLAPNRWLAVIWTDDGLVGRRKCASLGLSRLNKKSVNIDRLSTDIHFDNYKWALV